MIERIAKRGRSRLTVAALPAQFAGMRRLDTTPHPPERPEMGVSVAYGKGEVTGRVALYDRGLSDIPDGPESSTIYDEINQKYGTSIPLPE